MIEGECVSEKLPENVPVISKKINENIEEKKLLINIVNENEKLEDDSIVLSENIPKNDTFNHNLTLSIINETHNNIGTHSNNFVQQVEYTIGQIDCNTKLNDDENFSVISDSAELVKENDILMDVEELNILTEQVNKNSSQEVDSTVRENDILHNELQVLATDSKNVEKDSNECIVYEWHKSQLFCSSTEEFKPTNVSENFTKGCLWSPDGTCIMVPSEDFKIRIFDLPKELYYGPLSKNLDYPNYKSAVHIKEGGIIYDCCWFPNMNSYVDLMSCSFLSTSQGSPIHLWDAFTGQLRATYRAYNLVDEVEAALSIRFTNSGQQIWSGFKNALRNFDINRSSRQENTIFLKKDFPNVSGLVSCIREHPYMPGLIAFGTYSKCIGLYKDGPLCSLKTNNGVTQIEFSPCGNKLYSSVRKGNEFLCWDLRNPGSVLYSLENRQADTNQRVHFDISYNGEEVISGGTDGAVRVWRIPFESPIDEDLDPLYKIQVSKDCVNGVNLHKNLPILAVSTGSRIIDSDQKIKRENSLKLYWLNDRKDNCI